MIKQDYIEEAGQYFWQCVVEINNVKFVDHAILVSMPNIEGILNKRRSGKKTFKLYIN